MFASPQGFHKIRIFHAIRGWCGYNCMNMDNFLGTRGERVRMIDFCERKFQRRFHRNWQFSKRQRDLLMDINKSVAIMDCVAGAGKTTILLCMAMWSIKRNEDDGYDGCLHYMAENQQLADDFLNRLTDLMDSKEGIFPLGYDQVHMQDRLTADLRLKLQQSRIPVAVAVKRYEEAIDFTIHQYKSDTVDVQLCLSALRVLDVLKLILTAHHVATHTSFYS